MYLGALLAFSTECSSVSELGQKAYVERDYAAAAVAFEKAVSVCPVSKSLLLNWAQAQLLAQQLQPAQKTLEKLLALEPRNVHALKLKADVLYLLGDDSSAVETLLAAIRIEPANPDAVYALGRIYYQRGRHEDAVRQFLCVLELSPGSYKAYDNLGVAYEALTDYDRAIQNYLKAIELVHKDHPEYDWVYGNMANLMLKLGNNRKAFDLAVEASKRNPSSPRNAFLTGKALVRLDKPELAEKWLRRAAEIDPLYPEPRYLLGQVLRKLGRITEAEQEFRAFQEASSKTPQVRR